MIILHVSNLRFNRRWYQWLLEGAPRHDLLVIAGNLVDHNHASAISTQRDWVLSWLDTYKRPVCIATGPEDRMYDPLSNGWLPARWIQEAPAWVCSDEGFAEHGGFSIHCIGHGDRPVDRHADIWVAYRDPRLARAEIPGAGRGGDDAAMTLSSASAPPIILTGATADHIRWQSYERGTLHLNPGGLPFSPFPNHVLLDPATLASRRVSATSYIPIVDVFGPVERAIDSRDAALTP